MNFIGATHFFEKWIKSQIAFKVAVKNYEVESYVI